jgi:hypothetical protein
MRATLAGAVVGGVVGMAFGSLHPHWVWWGGFIPYLLGFN